MLSSFCINLRFAVFASGMRVKRVSIGDLNIVYGERGIKKKGQSSILLLHGFSADKFMWAPLVGVCGIQNCPL